MPELGKDYWPVEPTILYFVSYYPTNASGQAPTYVDPVMYNETDAIERAKALITENSNQGVAVIVPTSVNVIYPLVPYVEQGFSSN